MRREQGCAAIVQRKLERELAERTMGATLPQAGEREELRRTLTLHRAVSSHPHEIITDMLPVEEALDPLARLALGSITMPFRLSWVQFRPPDACA